MHLFCKYSLDLLDSRRLFPSAIVGEQRCVKTCFTYCIRQHLLWQQRKPPWHSFSESNLLLFFFVVVISVLLYVQYWPIGVLHGAHGRLEWAFAKWALTTTRVSLKTLFLSSWRVCLVSMDSLYLSLLRNRLLRPIMISTRRIPCTMDIHMWVDFKKKTDFFYCSLRCFSHSFDNTIRSWLLACAVGFRVLPLVERLVLSERLVWLALDSRLREESAFGMEWKEVTMVMSVVTLQTRKMPTNSMSACSLCSFSVKLWHYSKSKVYNVNRSCLLSPCSNGFSSKVVWLWLWFWVSVHTTAKFSKFGWVKMSAEHDKRRNLSPCTLLCWWSR